MRVIPARARSCVATSSIVPGRPLKLARVSCPGCGTTVGVWKLQLRYLDNRGRRRVDTVGRPGFVEERRRRGEVVLVVHDRERCTEVRERRR